MYKLIQSKITHHITYVNVLVLLNITFLMIFFSFFDVYGVCCCFALLTLPLFYPNFGGVPVHEIALLGVISS